MERYLFRRHLEQTVKTVIEVLRGYGYHVSLKARDPREPGRLKKIKTERKLQDVLYRRFQAQARELRKRWKEKAYPIPALPDVDDEEYVTEIMTILIEAMNGGVNIFSDSVTIGIDWSLVNKDVLRWARTSAGELVKKVDATTLESIRQAVVSFVQTPGFTIGDIVDMIPLDDIRASRIAITETTRAYARGQQIAADELQREFPDVKTLKRWFTNNDDRVCELCAPLDGMEIDTYDNFYDILDSTYEDGNPPRHINCRCWIDYRTDIPGSE